MDRLRVALSAAERNGTDVLVICLDLTNFRDVNDSLGHSAGDDVLGSIGARLRGCLRSGDTASRVGGDEFVVVCETANAVAESERISARLMEAITEPITVGSNAVSLGASIGISMFSADGPEARRPHPQGRPGDVSRQGDAAKLFTSIRRPCTPKCLRGRASSAISKRRSRATSSSSTTSRSSA